MTAPGLAVPQELDRDRARDLAAALDRLDAAIDRSQRYLLARQHAAGYWHAPLEANVGMDAQFILFNRFVGRCLQETEQRLVARMLAMQAADGSWPLYWGGPGHLNTTVEAYFALKLAGRPADDPALVRARTWILAQGGLARIGVFTRLFLAYFGQYPWDGLPNMPVELILLPPWSPVSIYRMASWARETVVPLTVLMARRPRVALPPGCGVEELWVRPPDRRDYAFRGTRPWWSVRNAFLVLDRVLALAERSPWKPLRRRAIARAVAWILERQDRNGGWGGIQPPMINCVMALKALGYPDAHPALTRGIQAIDEFLVDHAGQRFYQPCVSPTWDTALTMRALLDSGLPAEHPALVRAAEWLLGQQIFRPGDWSVYNPTLEPGGWAFEFANDWYPDTDDTAVILMVLDRVRVPDERARRRAMAYGTNWVLGMQSRNGGWGAFDTDNDSAWLNEIPFADMRAMIDPPTEDLTGRLLELLGTQGYDSRFGRARRALAFLRRTQRTSGAWWGRWGANFVYGTWSVLSGLRAIGEDMRAPWVRRAVAWLESVQNPDGGFGETLESYVDESLAGQGPSTPSQTAWGLLGLLAAADRATPAIERAAEWLLTHQRSNGGWDEDPYTGTGFPGHFYLRYWMYRDYFPLMALGRYRALRSGMAATERTT